MASPSRSNHSSVILTPVRVPLSTNDAPRRPLPLQALLTRVTQCQRSLFTNRSSLTASASVSKRLKSSLLKQSISFCGILCLSIGYWSLIIINNTINDTRYGVKAFQGIAKGKV
jgi:hypothetical protein